MGDALMLWSNGRAEAKVNLPEPSTDYAVAGDWAAGTHTVTLIMSNDRLSATCDRNLKIRSVGFWGPSQLPGTDGVAVRQVMDLSTGAFAPTSAGVGAADGARLRRTGSFTGTLDSQAATVLTIDLKAIPCQGNPRFSLRIDGRLVTEPVTLSAGSSSYRVSKAWTDALYTIEIGYLNDFATSTCDRNLEILGVTFHGRLVS
jgi:hypothetical protein